MKALVAKLIVFAMVSLIGVGMVRLNADAPKADATYDPALFQEMRWRHVGPFRGGRTVGAAGVVQQSNVFYIGVNNGGVWKTTDYGLTWTPIFDDQPTQSIGAVAVAPSDPNIVYVGSGEGLQRPDLSAADARPPRSGRRTEPDRHRDRAERSTPDLRVGHVARVRSLSIGRCGRELASDELRGPRVGPRRRLRERSRRPAEPRRRLRREH